ncbi:MAG TPA: hypothetical protein VE988_08930, partial [Gemmataceae bacterium]|nr:hypothetical protein [Gemmataceae bacterium]
PHDMYFTHADAASITGGYVYHGKRLPELVGTYICGDWMTCKVWSARFDKEKVTSRKEIAQGRMRIIAFGEDNDGELYILGYGDNADGVYQLVANSASDAAVKFPRKLSETGLLASTADLTPAPGVLPYSITAEQWIDHATATRLVALPDVSTVQFYSNAINVPGTAFFKSRIFFPKEAVLAKTIFIDMESGKPASKRRLETQLLHFNGDDWNGYTYRWNDAQTDAELVPAAGAEVELSIIDADAPGGKRQQTWHFASRAQCMICHNGWAGPPLGFSPEQLNRGGQLDQLQKLNVVAPAGGGMKGGKAPADGKIRTLATFADPYDAKQSLTNRARSYLDVNCAHCHQNGAGGTATIDLRAEVNLNNTKALNIVPIQGNFQIADGKLLSAGDPFGSVLYYRIGKTGPGRMPHIGSDFVDVVGVDLMHDWIASLAKNNNASHKNEQAALAALIAFKGSDITKDSALQKLLSSTPGAMMLARALDKKLLPATSHATIALVAADADGQIRDLFERFLPPEKRIKRLGTSIKPETILSLKGNPDQGRVVFFKTAGVQCATCHKIGDIGGAAGPDLSQIGKKLDRAKILESILEPSKDIDPAFVANAVQLNDGRVVIGLIVSRNDKELVLRDAQAKDHRFAAADVESVTPQRQSLMPEQLLRDLTVQQAVDLVDFLAGLKGQ